MCVCLMQVNYYSHTINVAHHTTSTPTSFVPLTSLHHHHRHINFVNRPSCITALHQLHHINSHFDRSSTTTSNSLPIATPPIQLLLLSLHHHTNSSLDRSSTTSTSSNQSTTTPTPSSIVPLSLQLPRSSPSPPHHHSNSAASTYLRESGVAGLKEAQGATSTRFVGRGVKPATDATSSRPPYPAIPCHSYHTLPPTHPHNSPHNS